MINSDFIEIYNSIPCVPSLLTPCFLALLSLIFCHFWIFSSSDKIDSFFMPKYRKNNTVGTGIPVLWNTSVVNSLWLMTSYNTMCLNNGQAYLWGCTFVHPNIGNVCQLVRINAHHRLVYYLACSNIPHQFWSDWR